MLKLHAGVSKKVGLPGFSSASASCTIEAELDSTLLNDNQGFQMVVRRAYQSCEQAVQDEIARLQGHDGANNDGTDHASSSQNRIQDFAPSPSPDSARAYSAQPHTTNGLSFGASKPATHRRLKTGHQVGGTGWKNRLLRTYVQGVSVQFVPSVPVFRSAAASPPRNRRAFPVGALAGFGPASAPPSAGRLWSR